MKLSPSQPKILLSLQIIPWLAIILYLSIFSALALWKYHNFGYNALDLAIFNQTFFNTAAGHPFALTIHPNTYLNDHFSPLLLLLVIFYLPFRHPLTLLILQNLVLAISAWPLFLIAKNILNEKWALFITLSFLLNPFTQNLSLYEFQLLLFALPLIFFAFYYYQQKKILPFLIFSSLAMLAREDVALVILMFGVLALIEKRKWRWVLTPIIFSAGYFILALKTISHFNELGTYKYLIYYSWLGNSLTHPLIFIFRFFQLGNLEMIFGLLLPFCFLQILKPKYLLLALPVYLQYFLGAPSTSDLILKTQYVTLFLPVLFLAFIFGLKKILNWRIVIKEKGLILILLIVAVVYSNITLGPLWGTVKKIFQIEINPEITQIKNQLLAQIPPRAPVAASYDFLAKVSGRPNAYALNYFFFGKTQFGLTPYQLPPDAEYLLVDFSDFLKYQTQAQNQPFYQADYALGDNRFREKIAQDNFGVIKIFDDLAIFKKNTPSEIQLYQIHSQKPKIANPQKVNLSDAITFLGFDQLPAVDELQPFHFYWQAQKNLTKNYQLQLSISNEAGKTIFQKFYPLAYSLYPTTEWLPNQIIQTNYWFWLNSKITNQNFHLKIQLIEIKKGGFYLDASRSAVFKVEKVETLGEPIEISY